MNIIWNKNPLYTQIMLDDHEKKEFWYKIKVEELQDSIITASFYLDNDKDYFDIATARGELDPSYFCAEWTDVSKKGQQSDLDKRCDEMLAYYISDLEVNPHGGDCTCVACSCSKCRAESILGIDTMPGLGKHEAVKINSAFGKDNANTIDEAITRLENYDPNPKKPIDWPDWVGFESHIPRWNQEAKTALGWLKTYRDKHFPKNSG